MAFNYRPGDEPVPGYRLVKFLGKGAIGEVWQATAPGGTEAALKMIDLTGSGSHARKEFRPATGQANPPSQSDPDHRLLGQE